MRTTITKIFPTSSIAHWFLKTSKKKIEPTYLNDMMRDLWMIVWISPSHPKINESFWTRIYRSQIPIDLLPLLQSRLVIFMKPCDFNQRPLFKGDSLPKSWKPSFYLLECKFIVLLVTPDSQNCDASYLQVADIIQIIRCQKTQMQSLTSPVCLNLVG